MLKSSRSVWRSYQKSLSLLDSVKAETMVVYKDDDFIALNKPPGLTVQGGYGIEHGCDLSSQLKYWQYNQPRPPSLAHRIDKNTTGVLLLTRHSEAARKMTLLFQERKIIKKYWAVTVSVPDKLQGFIEIPLGRKNITTKRKTHQMHRVVLRPDKCDQFSQETIGKRLPGDIRMASTKYSVISSYGQRCALIDVQLITGFQHQIRAHLADGLTCPIIGDYQFAGPLYRKIPALIKKMELIGDSKGFIRGPLYLHAYEVQVPSDKGKTLIINAAPPDYFIRTVNALGLKFPNRYKKLIRQTG